MTIKYYLDKPSAEIETAIYLFVRFGNSTLKFNTGKKVHPKYWNAKNPEMHFRRFTGSAEMNLWLNRLRGSIDVLYYSDTKWSMDDLREQITSKIKDEIPQDTAKTFSQALNEFITNREVNKDHALTTIKKYKTLESHLKGFEQKQRSPLRFEKVNKRFFEDFSAYLRNDVGNTNNTVNKYLKTFKTFINWAIDNGNVKADVVSTKFKISEQPTELIYLTSEELMSMYHLDLPLGSAKDKVRDVFCFGCLFCGKDYTYFSFPQTFRLILFNIH